MYVEFQIELEEKYLQIRLRACKNKQNIQNKTDYNADFSKNFSVNKYAQKDPLYLSNKMCTSIDKYS